MSEKLKVVDFPVTDKRDVAAMLREIAKTIDSGEFGEANSCVVVLNAEHLHVFGIGVADGTVTHYLLACAQRKIELPMVNK